MSKKLERPPDKTVAGFWTIFFGLVLFGAVKQNVAVVPVSAVWLGMFYKQFMYARNARSFFRKYPATTIVLATLSVVYMIVVIAVQT